MKLANALKSIGVIAALACAALLPEGPVMAQQDRQQNLTCDVIVASQGGKVYTERNLVVDYFGFEVEGYVSCSVNGLAGAPNRLNANLGSFRFSWHGPSNPNQRAPTEAQLQHDRQIKAAIDQCVMFATLAMSNPSKYEFHVELTNPRVFSRNSPTSMEAWLDNTAGYLQCGVARNMSGLE